MIVAQATGAARPMLAPERSTIITDSLNMVWDGVSRVLSGGRSASDAPDGETLARDLLDQAKAGKTVSNTVQAPEGGALFSVATPIELAGAVQGVVALTSAEGEIDRLVRYEREQVLQMFVIALLVSIGLSLVLASTIANPLSDLAAAAELGRDRDARKMAPGRVRIPDLTARPDEIGRLSVAMRGMVTALYDRIDANEQFAADPSPIKVNLGVGVYFDDQGKLPLLQCVQQAEHTMMAKPTARGYLPIDGIAAYDAAVKSLVFGKF